VERPLTEPGTEVYIYGIDREKKLLSPERLADYLAGEFEEDLIEGRFKLELQQDGQRLSVTRDRIVAGTPIISDRRIATRWGDIVVNVSYGGKGGVALARRGITVVRNISDLPEMESEIWKSGKIGGSVRFDSINVSTDKKNPVRDELFMTLISELTEMEPELREAVKKIEESESEKTRERLYSYLASRLDQVLKDLNFDRVRALMEAKKRAEQETEAESAKGKGFGGENREVREKTGKPLVSKGKHRKSVKSVYGINWVEESDLEHPKCRSRFDPKFGTVYINKVHQDFTRRVLKARNDFEKLDYFYKLTTKEIVLHQFEGAPPVDVLEALLDIQLAMEKAPPGL
jgi:hypothetical protein